jgi:uncharacterized protein
VGVSVTKTALSPIARRPNLMIESSPTSSDKVAAMLTHIAGIFFWFIPSLIVYLASTENPWVKNQARLALNFQLTMLIAAIIGGALVFIGIGIFIIWAVEIAIVVFSIVAALKANQGEAYKYPLSIDLVKS